MSEHQQNQRAAPPSAPGRPPMRPDMRPESVIRAEQRAREIRKVQTTASPPDILNLAAELAPEGWEYQLKRKEVFGKEDVKHATYLAYGGWEAVDVEKRHPTTYIPTDCVLMEKPKTLVDEERYLERKLANDVVKGQRQKLAETPGGTMPRDAHLALRPKIETNYAPMEVRDE